jgi:hypothetical protein
MMKTALDVAAAAVGSALAISSTGVSIRFDPLTITPLDAFTFQFSHFNTQLDVFRAHLAQAVPTPALAGVQALNYVASTQIQLVVDAVEAIIAAL